MTARSMESVLVALRPDTDLKVMDLVEAAGIDVRPWSVKEGGLPVRNPKANPNYCYDWAFGQEGEPIALCVWHSTLRAGPDAIFYEANLRQWAAELEAVAFERGVSAEIKSRAKGQAKRCDRFDRRVQRAYRAGVSVRVILLVGDRVDVLGHDVSHVSSRRLDDKTWWVHAYDDAKGAFRLVRVQQPSIHGKQPDAPQHDPVDETLFEDQFSVPGRRLERHRDVFARSPEVRRRVLKRAGGKCERCERPGFATISGRIYLETHHVIPLCEQGDDATSNMVALCPDDHRRAHLSTHMLTIRDELLAHLSGLSPASHVD